MSGYRPIKQRYVDVHLFRELSLISRRGGRGLQNRKGSIFTNTKGVGSGGNVIAILKGGAKMF